MTDHAERGRGSRRKHRPAKPPRDGGRPPPPAATVTYELGQYRPDLDDWKAKAGSATQPGLDASLGRAFKSACAALLRSGVIRQLPPLTCQLEISFGVDPLAVQREDLEYALEELLRRLLRG